MRVVGVGVGRRATGLMGVEVCVVGEPGAVDVLATPGALSKGSIFSVIFLLVEKKANAQFLSHKGVF